jgi:hypothetical protein
VAATTITREGSLQSKICGRSIIKNLANYRSELSLLMAVAATKTYCFIISYYKYFLKPFTVRTVGKNV